MSYSSIKIVQIVLLIVNLVGCKSSGDFRPDLEQHQFDPTVIDNLPRYDTLRQIVLNHFDSFHPGNTKNDFTYLYSSDSTAQMIGHNNSDLPPGIYPATVELFKNIRKGNIFGFVLYRDSAFSILVRNTHLTEYYLDVRERLYWYPETKQKERAEFPGKDTMLTGQWRYEIYYDKRAGF